MLISISDAFLTAPDVRDMGHFCDAMNNLLLAHRHGQHLLAIERPVIDWLLGSNLSEQSMGMLRSLKTQALNVRSAQDWVTESILVVPESGVRTRWDRTTCRVPWGWFTSPISISPSRLIGEDVDRDVAIYLALANGYAAQEHLRVHLSGQGGGGSQTGSNLRNEARKGIIALAIVDSDRKSPMEKLGDTAWAACKAAAEVGALRCDEDREGDRHALPQGPFESAISRLIVLRVRELENLLPHDLWERALSDPASRARLGHLLTLGFVGEDETRWVDLKQGLLCQKTLGETAEAHALRTLLEHPRCSSVPLSCGTREACTRPDESPCSRRLVDGLGPKALAEVARVLDGTAARETLKSTLPSTTSFAELHRVLRIIAEWGLASSPSRT